jgi:hypothetical protein
MGAEHPKPVKKMNKVDLEIVCDKVYQYLMLHRGRKIDELALKERAVKEKLANKKKLYGDCLFDVSSIVSLLNWILAAKIVMRNVQFIKERSIQIASAANERNSEKIAPLIKYIQSVIWASDRLNLNQIKEFTYMIGAFFGGEFIKLAREGHGIDPELANCFKFVEPTKPQVGDYLRNMLKRYGFDQIDLEKELPPSYRQPSNQQAPPPPSPAPNNGDFKFDYNQNPPSQGGGFFDNPHNMAGQSNWGKFLGPNYSQNNNLSMNTNNMGKLAPSRIDDPAYHQMNNNQNPNPNVVPDKPHHPTPAPPQNKEEDDFDQMLKDLQEGSIVKDGNELVNPSMSQMNLGSKAKPNPPPKDDFDDLINSLQGNVVADLKNQEKQPPAMRGPPKRRNKAKKPISSEPEAYQYTDEIDGDTEEKHYEELSLEYRLEEMRKLKI